MNWKLVLQLSLFGLVMGIATVFVIPSSIEWIFWLVAFAISAWMIAQRCATRHFLHGFAVAAANSVWVTAAHLLLFESYAIRHTEELEAMLQVGVKPGTLMVFVVMPASALIFGGVLGLFAFVAGKYFRRAKPATPGNSFF